MTERKSSRENSFVISQRLSTRSRPQSSSPIKARNPKSSDTEENKTNTSPRPASKKLRNKFFLKSNIDISSMLDKSKNQANQAYEASGFTEKPFISLRQKSSVVNNTDPLRRILDSHCDKEKSVKKIHNDLSSYISPVIQDLYPKRKPLYERPLSSNVTSRPRKSKKNSDPFLNFVNDKEKLALTANYVRKPPELILRKKKKLDDHSEENLARRETMQDFIKERRSISSKMMEFRQVYYRMKKEEAIEDQITCFSIRMWFTMIYLHRLLSSVKGIVNKTLEIRRARFRKSVVGRLVINKFSKNSCAAINRNFPLWEFREINRAKQ